VPVRRTNLPLWFALAVSVLLHVFVLLPVMIRVLTAPSGHVAHAAQLTQDDDQQRDERKDSPDKLKLGIDDGSPSTLTWIGYEQYEKHLAQLSEVEQAAFTDDPVASPTPPTPMPSPAPSEQPAESARSAAPQPASEDAPTRAEAEATDSMSSGAQGTQQGNATAELNAEPADFAAKLDAPLNDDAEPTERSTSNAPPISHALLAFAEQLRLFAEAAGADGDDDEHHGEAGAASQAANSAERPQQQQSAPEQGRSAPSAAATPADPDAQQADLDSVASSEVKVPYDELRPGKPLAARGLKLRPQRPEFVTLTVMTSAPGNPLVEIGFMRNGTPLVARVIESSGDTRIDNTVEASLYRWRAEGEPLRQLTGEQTLNVRIRIILNPRR